VIQRIHLLPPICLCVSRGKRDIRCVRFNRSCAFEAFPELRSSTTSADTFEQLHSRRGYYETQSSDYKTRSTNGGRHCSTVTAPESSRWSSVGRYNQHNGLPSECQSSTDDNEGDHGLRPSQGSDPDGHEQPGPINDATPVALRIRRPLQSFHSELMVVKENLNKIQIRTKTSINLTIDYTEQGSTTHDRETKFSCQGLPKGSINCQVAKVSKQVEESSTRRVQSHGFESGQTLYTEWSCTRSAIHEWRSEACECTPLHGRCLTD
jgi:hypothetical protein